MPIDLKYLKSQGISAGSYKGIFSGPRSKYRKLPAKLNDLIAARIRDGRTMNLTPENWRAFAAIDLAHDVAFDQTTPTLIQNILSRHLNATDTKLELEKWGLKEDELFLKIPQPGGGNQLMLNPPVFFQVFLPIVKAYVTIRLAKLFNERNTQPLLAYKPLKDTTRNRILCEIITDLINNISTWYGYSSVLRQSIQQMLKYGVMLAFTREEWHREQHLFQADGDAKAELVTIKEGLRYIHPHPTRMFYDLNYPLTSLNSDTGCEYAGHWHIVRYGDILDDRRYWNRKDIFCGTNWFSSPGAEKYFSEVYPCTMEFPPSNTRPVDREDRSAFYSTTTDRDKAVFLTEIVMKIIPRDYGLGAYEGDKLVRTYNYPVWHRFTVAGDDTIIWASPCAYTPATFMGYDYDENAARNPSIALETIPWQDHLGMILSQMLLTAKQNLANIVFYNNQAVDKGDVEKVLNSGEKKYRGWNFIGYDALKFNMAKIDVDKVFHMVKFDRQSIQEFLQMVPMLLNLMERLLQISAQEAGAAASHYQSKEEVVRTGSASSNRLQFTASFVDDWEDAWKRQLHDGAQAYMNPDVSAQVSPDIPDLEQHLTEMGFTIEHRGNEKLVVKGNKLALRLEGFAASGAGPDPAKDRAIAQVIFQVVGVVSGQPDLVKKIGAKSILRLVEQAAMLAGAPRDFRLQLDSDGAQNGEVSAQILQAIQQAQGATLQAVEQKIGAPAAQAVADNAKRTGALEEAVKGLQRIYDIAKAQQQSDQVKVAEAQQKMQLRQAEAVENERRKEEDHQAELRREEERVRAEIEIDRVKAAAKLTPA